MEIREHTWVEEEAWSEVIKYFLAEWKWKYNLPNLWDVAESSTLREIYIKCLY